MKTGSAALSIVQVNYTFDKELADPEALIDRYRTLTGWGEALVGAGAARSTVVQRFGSPARLSRRGVEYLFLDRGVSKAVAAVGADLVHVNGLIFPARTWMLRRALRPATAIVAQNHSDTGPMGRAPGLRLVGRAARGAVDAFLFAAEEHAERWRVAGLVADAQPVYQVMEASSDFQPMARDAARARSRIEGSPALLWVGRLDANKDPLTVLDGFERVLGVRPDAALTMVYSGSELLALVRARLDDSPALRRRVRLMGEVPHDDLPALYSAADLFVLGSHHEGSGYALIEASACGTVPVVTDIPSFRLLTGGGSVGALWPPGNASAFAAAVLDMCGRDLDRERARTIDHFVRNFSWPAIGRRALEIYADVVRRRSVRRA